MLYVWMSTCDNMFVSKLSWQQHQSPHNSATGNHIKAQLHLAGRLSDTGHAKYFQLQLNANWHLHWYKRWEYVNLPFIIEKTACERLQEQNWEVVLTEKGKYIKNVCVQMWIQVCSSPDFQMMIIKNNFRNSTLASPMYIDWSEKQGSTLVKLGGNTNTSTSWRVQDKAWGVPSSLAAPSKGIQHSKPGHQRDWRKSRRWKLWFIFCFCLSQSAHRYVTVVFSHCSVCPSKIIQINTTLLCQCTLYF